MAATLRTVAWIGVLACMTLAVLSRPHHTSTCVWLLLAALGCALLSLSIGQWQKLESRPRKGCCMNCGADMKYIDGLACPLCKTVHDKRP